MIISAGNDVKHEYSIMGVAGANSIMVTTMKTDAKASLEYLRGRTMHGYEDKLDETVSIALAKLEEKAHAFEADGVINLKVELSSLNGGSVIVYVYGDLIKFKE